MFVKMVVVLAKVEYIMNTRGVMETDEISLAKYMRLLNSLSFSLILKTIRAKFEIR